MEVRLADNPRPRPSSVASAVAVSTWLLLWVLLAAFWDGEDPWYWPLVVLPQFALGFAIGRTWAIPLPFALVALAPLFGPSECLDPEGCETGYGLDFTVVILLAGLCIPGAASAAAGVVVRRIWNKRGR